MKTVSAVCTSSTLMAGRDRGELGQNRSLRVGFGHHRGTGDIGQLALNVGDARFERDRLLC